MVPGFWWAATFCQSRCFILTVGSCFFLAESIVGGGGGPRTPGGGGPTTPLNPGGGGGPPIPGGGGGGPPKLGGDGGPLIPGGGGTPIPREGCCPAFSFVSGGNVGDDSVDCNFTASFWDRVVLESTDFSLESLIVASTDLDVSVEGSESKSILLKNPGTGNPDLWKVFTHFVLSWSKLSRNCY